MTITIWRLCDEAGSASDYILTHRMGAGWALAVDRAARARGLLG